MIDIHETVTLPTLSCTVVLPIAILAAIVAAIVRRNRTPASSGHGRPPMPPAIAPTDASQGVEVAQMADSTLRYLNGRFMLDGVGVLTPQEVWQRERSALLIWSSPQTREWFLQSFAAWA